MSQTYRRPLHRRVLTAAGSAVTLTVIVVVSLGGALWYAGCARGER